MGRHRDGTAEHVVSRLADLGATATRTGAISKRQDCLSRPRQARARCGARVDWSRATHPPFGYAVLCTSTCPVVNWTEPLTCVAMVCVIHCKVFRLEASAAA